MLLVDTDADRITWANSRACELLGYSHEELRSLDPKAIHPHEYDAFRSFVEEVAETSEGWTGSLSCYTCDGDVIPAEISGTRVTLDGSQHLLASIRDVSTRVESPTEIIGQTWGDLHAERQRFALGIASALASTGKWRGEVTAAGDGRRPLEALVTRLETEEILCVAHDISAQQAHEHQLTGLASASRELLAAEDSGAMSQVDAEAVVDVLDMELACLRRYDESKNKLTIATISKAAKRLLAEAVAYDLNSSRAGVAYRHGEMVRNELSDDAYAAGTERADLYVPTGEYGVLSVFEPSGSFSDQRVQLVELFAESGRAAFIQADRETRLRSRQTELEARTNELTVASQFNELVTESIELMLRTPHRGEIEQAVCDGLAASDFYAAAWIATLDGETDSVAVSTHRVDTDPFTETDPAAFVASSALHQLLRVAEGKLVAAFFEDRR